MRILIRLPNWLGDMVMSVGFVRAVHQQFPDAEIDVICKKGMEDLLTYFPFIHQQFIFSKAQNKGVFGAYKFVKKNCTKNNYDIFFSLPNSFSAALMGFATQSKKRIGFKNEGRSFLLTNSYSIPKNLHRAEEYIFLLEKFTTKNIAKPLVEFEVKKENVQQQILVNFNSEAASRRMPTMNAISILQNLLANFSEEIILIGAPKDKPYIDALCNTINNNQVKNYAGKTSLKELMQLMANCKTMLSVDSGPSHLCNALKTKVVVLHGADDESNTEAYNKNFVDGMRYGKLPCEPCVKNICKIYDSPKCLEMLDEELMVAKLKSALKN